jgi:hypothetical protein
MNTNTAFMRKTRKRWFTGKLLSSLLLILTWLPSIGQGTDCFTAIQHPIGNTCNVQEHVFNSSTTSRWIEIVPTSNAVDITLTNPENPVDTPVVEPSEVIVYAGNCNGLTSVQSFSIPHGTALPYTVTASGLTENSSYYIEIKRYYNPNSTCRICREQNAYLGVCVQANILVDPWVNQICACIHPEACNLICNGSFEDQINCSLTLGDIYLACPWSHGNFATADLFNANECHPNTNMGVPINPFGNEPAHTGNGYAGIFAYMANQPNQSLNGYREYIRQQLNAPLIAAHTYQVQFWVSLAEQSKYAIANLGAYLSPNDPLNAGTQYQLNYTPQVVNNSGVIANKIGWTLISGTFTSTLGGEQWITIGNFKNNSGTTVQQIGGNTWDAYYFIDDVSIKDITYPLTASPSSTTICQGDNVTLFASQQGTVQGYQWSPATGLNTTVGQTVVATPSVTTTYTVSVACDQATVTVFVNPAPNANAGADQSICPGQSAQLSGSGGNSYSWQPANSLSCATCSNPVATPTVTTTYTLTVTDALGCTGQDVVTVNLHTLPNNIISSTATSACDANAIYVVNYDPNYQYTWTIGNGTPIVSGQGSNSITVDWTAGNGGSTNVDVTITDLATGCSALGTLHIGECCIWGLNEAYNFYNTSTTGISSIATIPGWYTVSGGTYVITNHNFTINGTFTVNQNLTLEGCQVKMGYNAEIILAPGVQFLVDKKTNISACNEMWKRMLVDGTNPNTRLIVRDGSTVQDAMEAIVSTNGGRFELYTTTVDRVKFNKNFKNIVVQNYNGQHPGFVRQTDFNCADMAVPQVPNISIPPHTLRYPHIGQRTYLGADIEDVANFPNMGDPTTAANKNVFRNMDYGIYGLRSSITAQNNEFIMVNNPNTLGCKTCPCPIGTGICAEGQQGNPVTVTVGGSPAATNRFQDCGNGVFVRNYVNLYATDNQFTTISNEVISVLNAPNGSITIRNNIFDYWAMGIAISNIPGAFATIDANQFNYTTTLPPSGPQPYSFTAIRVQNVFPQNSSLFIQNNDIKRIRLGIVVTNVNGAVITNNNPIWFTANITATSPKHYGIWTQNSRSVLIRDNFIKRLSPDPTSSLIDITQGIRLEKCITSTVEDNTVQRMGSGIRCVGNNGSSRLACNLLDRCYYGFKMGENNAATDIGTQLTNGQATGNYWIDNPYANAFRIEGAVTPSGTNWFSGATGNYFVNALNTSTLGLVYPIGSTNSCTPGTPPQLTPITANERELNFGAIVRDEKQFSDHVPERKVWDKAATYKAIKDDPSMLTLGSSDDATYQVFYSTMQASNTGKLVDVQDHITSGNLTAASNLNATIAGADVMESNKKIVNDIFLATWAVGNYEFSQAQSETLQYIADQFAIEGGDAVYSARVLLGLEVHEYVPNTQRTAGQEMEISEFVEPSIYPNPANGEVNLSYSLSGGQSGTFELFDMIGNKITAYQLSDSDTVLSFFTKEMAAGVYLYKLTIGGELIKADKFIVVK